MATSHEQRSRSVWQSSLTRLPTLKEARKQLHRCCTATDSYMLLQFSSFREVQPPGDESTTVRQAIVQWITSTYSNFPFEDQTQLNANECTRQLTEDAELEVARPRADLQRASPLLGSPRVAPSRADDDRKAPQLRHLRNIRRNGKKTMQGS